MRGVDKSESVIQIGQFVISDAGIADRFKGSLHSNTDNLVRRVKSGRNWVRVLRLWWDVGAALVLNRVGIGAVLHMIVVLVLDRGVRVGRIGMEGSRCWGKIRVHGRSRCWGKIREQVRIRVRVRVAIAVKCRGGDNRSDRSGVGSTTVPSTGGYGSRCERDLLLRGVIARARRRVWSKTRRRRRVRKRRQRGDRRSGGLCRDRGRCKHGARGRAGVRGRSLVMRLLLLRLRRRGGFRGRRSGLLPPWGAWHGGRCRDRGRDRGGRGGGRGGDGRFELDPFRDRTRGRRARALHRLRHVLLVVANVAQVVAELTHAPLDGIAVCRPAFRESTHQFLDDMVKGVNNSDRRWKTGIEIWIVI